MVKKTVMVAIFAVMALAIGRTASAFTIIELLSKAGGDEAVPVVVDNTVNKTLDGTGFSVATSKTPTGQIDGIISIISVHSPEFDTAGLTRSIAIPKALSIPATLPDGNTVILAVQADGSLTCGGTPAGREECSDGVDNDGDGCVDQQDCDCVPQGTKCSVICK